MTFKFTKHSVCALLISLLCIFTGVSFARGEVKINMKSASISGLPSALNITAEITNKTTDTIYYCLIYVQAFDSNNQELRINTHTTSDSTNTIKLPYKSAKGTYKVMNFDSGLSPYRSIEKKISLEILD